MTTAKNGNGPTHFAVAFSKDLKENVFCSHFSVIEISNAHPLKVSPPPDSIIFGTKILPHEPLWSTNKSYLDYNSSDAIAYCCKLDIYMNFFKVIRLSLIINDIELILT